MIKTMIVDDEPLALEFAKQLLEQHDELEVIGAFTNSVECMEAVQKNVPHLVILDIHMPDVNGLELAERLLEIDSNIYIVFLTAYNAFAVEAFELDALDYIIKPIRKDRLQMTIDRFLKKRPLSSVHNESIKESSLAVNVNEYLTFEMEEGRFEPIPWRTSKAQELFIYMLQNNGHYIEKETLMELLWEDKDLESSASLLYTNIYNVRRALKQFGDHFDLKNRLDGYVLEMKNVKVDIFDWEEKTLDLQPISEENITIFETQINNFPGKYLLKHDYVWLEQKRQSLTRLWQQCVDAVIEFYYSNNEWTKAIGLLRRICEKHPGDESIHFALMKLYAKTEDLDAIATQYRKLIRGLRAELDISPSVEVQKWYKENVIKKLSLDIKEI